MIARQQADRAYVQSLARLEASRTALAPRVTAVQTSARATIRRWRTLSSGTVIAYGVRPGRVPTLAARPLATPQPRAHRALCSPSAKYGTCRGWGQMLRHVHCNVIADKVQDLVMVN
jgi:hypothetical protein